MSMAPQKKKAPRWQRGCAWLAAAFLALTIVVIILAPEPEQATGEAEKVADPKSDALAFHRKFMGIVAPCDEAGKQVSAAADAGDPIEVYRASNAAEGACLSISERIEGLNVPESLPKEEREALTKAKETCASAYLSRWYAANRLKEALENLSSIAAQAELRDATEALEAQTMICAAGLVAVPMSLGATPEELGMSD